MRQLHYCSKENIFGIEAFLLEYNETVFLKYCFIIDSTMIGDINQTCVLNPQIDILKNIILKKGTRKLNDYATQKLNTLTDKLIELYNTTKNDSIINSININSISCEAFDATFTFLIEEISYDLFLAKDLFNKKYYGKKLPKGIFYSEIQLFYNWILKNTRITLK